MAARSTDRARRKSRQRRAGLGSRLRLRWRAASAARKTAVVIIGAIAPIVLGAVASYYAPGVLARLFGNDEMPVAVTVQRHPVIAVGGRAGTVVVPQPYEQLGSPPKGDCGPSLHDFAVGLGGADAGATNLRLVLQGRASAVLVTVRIKVVERRPAQDGTYLACPRGGDFAVPRDVRINLDEPTPSVRYFVQSKEVKSPFILSIPPGTSEIVDLHITASKGLYRWTAELELLADGRRRTEPIDDHGQPFRTTSLAKDPSHIWNGEEWRTL
jgi:hypothetical protein